jgi:hypothetical protein
MATRQQSFARRYQGVWMVKHGLIERRATVSWNVERRQYRVDLNDGNASPFYLRAKEMGVWLTGGKAVMVHR